MEWFVELDALMRQRRLSLGRLADDRYFLVIRQHIAIDRALNRLPGKRVVIDLLDNVDGRRFAAIGQRAGLLDQPTIAFASPLAFGKAAVGVEYPRANLFRHGIPANDLHPGHVHQRQLQTSES